ncbi:hypothetical protein V8E36_007523 [Tilletia maclaganii]
MTTATKSRVVAVAHGGAYVCLVTASGAGKSGLWHYALAHIKTTPGKLIFLIPSVLIISLNKVVGQHFSTWLQEPRNLARVHKVVFDEAHVLLDERSFRLLMDAVQGKQAIFLPATMPPLETEFQNAVMTPVVLKRDLTHRPNVEQNVQVHPNDAHLSDPDRHTKTPEGEDNGKQTIVWVMTRRDAERWSKMLDMPAVYSDPDDRTGFAPEIACGINIKKVVLAF